MKKILCMVLALMLVMSLLPVTATAAEKRSGEILVEDTIAAKAAMALDENGYNTFTTFEDLKIIMKNKYQESTIYMYAGTDIFEITESITIPQNLEIVIDHQVTITENATLTVNGALYGYTLSVKGSLTNNGVVLVGHEMSVKGSLYQNGELIFVGAMNYNLSGEENISYGGESNYILWMHNIDNGIYFENVINNIANEPSQARNMHALVLSPYPSTVIDIQLNKSLTVPENCMIQIFSPTTISLPEGCALTINGPAYVQNTFAVNGDVTVGEYGYFYVYSPITVAGKLQNYGQLDIYCNDGAYLAVNSGKYEDADMGVIYVNTDDELPADALQGLNKEYFEVYEELEDVEHYWVLHSYTIPCSHAFGDWTVELEATCQDGGLERRDCQYCDYYETRSIGLADHAYDNDQDSSCNTCDFLRVVESTVPAPEGTTAMYRMYNPNSGEHFYTGSKDERNTLNAAGWHYEGIGWYAPISSGDPVYRTYNPNSGDHHYTMSWEEVEMLVGVGWKYEGVCWNSASAKDGMPLYRLYNPNADCGSHHYTGSTEERDFLVSVGWIYEGIGWYGIK